MDAKEFGMKASEILAKLESPEDVGGILESMVNAYVQRDSEAEKFRAENEEQKAKIDRLQRANMELYLRSGAGEGMTGDELPEDGEKAEEISPDFSAAMDENGNII